MGKIKDLTGQRFGRLYAASISDKRTSNGACVYICQCDCGNVKEISGSLLKRGEIKSCGCLRKEIAKYKADKIKGINQKDISGQKFGRLVAIKPTNQRQGNSKMWECKCECGNTILASIQCLKSGMVRSCGCLKTETLNKTREILFEKELKEGTMLCQLNKKLQKNNTSGRKGVYWREKGQVWYVSITFQGKTHYVGSFKDYNEAVKAREQAEIEYFKPILEENGRKLEQ